jgi:hypothetical protein
VGRLTIGIIADWDPAASHHVHIAGGVLRRLTEEEVSSSDQGKKYLSEERD